MLAQLRPRPTPQDLLDLYILTFLADETTVPGHDPDAIRGDLIGTIELTAHWPARVQRRLVGARYRLHRRVLDRLLVEAADAAAANARRRRAA